MDNQFIFSSEKIDGGVEVNGFFLKGDFFQSEGHYFFFKKELYELDKPKQEYFKEYILNPESFVSERKGDFALFDFNSQNNEIFFATDKLGKENMFFTQGDKFLITNSFWEGISVLHLKEEDIDWLNVKKMIIYNMTPFYRTIIKGYDVVAPARIAKVRKKGRIYNVEFKTYWEMKFKPQETTLEETAEKVYHLFDNTFDLLAKKYSEDTKFGVGLSGGWDSRLVVYFAQRHNLKLVPYCIGEKYLFFPIKTNGYKVVKRLADFFGIDNFKFIPYNSESYLQKLAREIKLTPDRASNIEISCLSKIPDFDVLLGGIHGGVFFGEFDFEPLLKYKKENFADCLLGFLSYNKNENMIMSDAEREVLREDIQGYINSLEMNNRFEIYYRYFFEVRAQRSKRGFFESLHGTKARYSMFLDPDFIDDYLTWEPFFLANRTLQRFFFKKYLPELSKIPDETTDAPLYWRDSSIKNVPIRFLFGIKNYVFKSSLRRARWISRDKDFKRLMCKVENLNFQLIQEHFPQLDLKVFYKSNPRATATLLKVILVIDAVLNCEKDIEEYIISKYDC